MATVKVTINTENAAFTDFPGAELERIFTRLAEQTSCIDRAADLDSLPIMDCNGNKVGKVTVTGKD